MRQEAFHQAPKRVFEYRLDAWQRQNKSTPSALRIRHDYLHLFINTYCPCAWLSLVPLFHPCASCCDHRAVYWTVCNGFDEKAVWVSFTFDNFVAPRFRCSILPALISCLRIAVFEALLLQAVMKKEGCCQNKCFRWTTSRSTHQLVMQKLVGEFFHVFIDRQKLSITPRLRGI